MTPPAGRRRVDILVEDLERTTGELQRTLGEMRAQRRHEAVEGVKRELAETERELGEMRKLRAEPIIDAAVEDGRIAASSRETWLAAAAAGIDVKSQLAGRKPTAELATANHFAAEDNEAEYRRYAQRQFKLSSEEII